MVYIIAEVGVNHNGDKEIAKEMIKIAKKCGANAVKFQTFKTSLLVDKNTKKTKYQIENDSKEETAEEMLKRLELKYEDYEELLEISNKLNIDFISTPFDVESASFLNKLKLKKIKVGSGDLTNYQLIKFLVSKTDFEEIILSTGMSNMNEIEDAVNFIKSLNKKIVIRLLHCVSNYPTSYHEINMKCIDLIRKTNLDVGFSDHTKDNLASIVAASMGATILEKHFTLDKKMEGPDHKASLEPKELEEYVNEIRNVEIILGNKVKICQESEKDTKQIVRRTFFIEKDLKKGEIIKEEYLISKRPLDGGICASQLNNIIGKKLLVNKKKGERLERNNIE